jgi:integrase
LASTFPTTDEIKAILTASGRPERDGAVLRVPQQRLQRTEPEVVKALKEWKMQCPNSGAHGLVFPTPSGDGIALHNNTVRAFIAAVRAAGLVDKKGAPKYSGLHALRHFFASWCINPQERGGLALPPKVVQQRLGHSSIVMTMDT